MMSCEVLPIAVGCAALIVGVMLALGGSLVKGDGETTCLNCGGRLAANQYGFCSECEESEE